MQVNNKLRAKSASSPGKQSLLPTDYGAKWAQKTVWALWRRDNPFFLSRNEPRLFGWPAHNLVNVQIVLYQLLEKVCGGYYKP